MALGIGRRSAACVRHRSLIPRSSHLETTFRDPYPDCNVYPRSPRSVTLTAWCCVSACSAEISIVHPSCNADRGSVSSANPALRSVPSPLLGLLYNCSNVHLLRSLEDESVDSQILHSKSDGLEHSDFSLLAPPPAIGCQQRSELSQVITRETSLDNLPCFPQACLFRVHHNPGSPEKQGRHLAHVRPTRAEQHDSRPRSQCVLGEQRFRRRGSRYDSVCLLQRLRYSRVRVEEHPLSKVSRYRHRRISADHHSPFQLRPELLEQFQMSPSLVTRPEDYCLPRFRSDSMQEECAACCQPSIFLPIGHTSGIPHCC